MNDLIGFVITQVWYVSVCNVHVTDITDVTKITTLRPNYNTYTPVFNEDSHGDIGFCSFGRRDTVFEHDRHRQCWRVANRCYNRYIT